MQTDELIALAIGGIALWMLFVSRRAAAAPASPQQLRAGGFLNELVSSKPADYVIEVANPAAPGEPGWGWRYYSNGTAIDSAGKYYFQGQAI